MINKTDASSFQFLDDSPDRLNGGTDFSINNPARPSNPASAAAEFIEKSQSSPGQNSVSGTVSRIATITCVSAPRCWEGEVYLGYNFLMNLMVTSVCNNFTRQSNGKRPIFSQIELESELWISPSLLTLGLVTVEDQL